MDTATDSGGRVTRALRKRLTSIDSDNGSSRPGTPVQTKLAAAVTNSPLKPRMARRHSTSGVGTPVKTPGKRAANAVAAIAETEETTATPNRRVTRRSSITQIENEATPKLDMKTPNFKSVEEEEKPTTRITRSKSKSPEQAKGRPKSALSQRGRRSMLRKDAVNLSYVKADTNVDIEKDTIDGQSSVGLNKKDKLEDPNPSPIKRKPGFTETNSDKKNQDNKKEELDESTPSTKKRKALLTDEKKLNESSEDSKFLNTPAIISNIKPELEDDGVKIIASPKKKSLSIREKTTDDKGPGKDNKNNIQKKKSPEIKKVDHMETPNDSEAEDKLYTYPQDRKSLSTSVGDICTVPPEEIEIVVEKRLSKIEMIEEDGKVTSPLKIKSLETNKSPQKENDDHETQECIDEQEVLVGIGKTKENKTTHDVAPSTSVLLMEDPVKLLDGNTTENLETTENVDTADDDNEMPLTSESREAASPNLVDGSQKQANLVEAEDVIATNLNDSAKTVSVTSSQSSDNKSDLKADSITPTINTIGVKQVADADNGSPKRVVFSLNVFEDECEKSSYPKTPASVKSKSFISSNEEKTSPGEQCSNNDSVEIVHDTTDVEIPETQDEEIGSARNANKTIADQDTILSITDDTNVTNEMEIIACFSPAEIDDDKSTGKEIAQPNESEICKESCQDSSSLKSPDMKLRWYNPSVVAKSSKLDTITREQETTEDKSALDDDQVVKQKKKRTFLKRDEWNDDNESPCEEDDDEEEDEEEEQMNARKHPFHDDEVMVVDDYESGDSMDSEERREIMENEIAIDGESIGSHTTDGEDNDEEESENDSFIVSDNCDDEDIGDDNRSESDDEVEESNDVKNTDREKKKYKRIQRITETSSSDEDESCNENLGEAKDTSENRDSDINLQLKHNKSLNSSRLSDLARRLQSDPEDESYNSKTEDAINISRKEILRNLNKSDRFNKSVRELNPEVDVSPDTLAATTTNNISVTSANLNETKNPKSGECAEVDSEEGEPTSTSGNASETELIEGEQINLMTSISSSKHAESHLGEVSVTSEEETCNAKGGSDTDDEKENAVVKQTPKPVQLRGLSASFGAIKQQKTLKYLQKKVLQRSFTIGVSVNGDALETEVFQNKVTESEIQSSTTPSASLSSNEDTDGDVLSSDDARYLENIKHLPLGNPLVRTRRQSLALPTNPDMEIGSAQHSSATHKTKNHKRKSLTVLSGNELNPSQSFVDGLELRKAELQRQSSKRKRLSKSFCGTTADNSVVDIDVRHLHKRSKIAPENSFVDSFENTKPNNSMCLKVEHSSTPHEKGSTQKHNNSGIRRILSRCDEILEAANRAKLEAKLNYRKSKIRLPKKHKKRMQRQPSSPETKRDNVFAPITKEIRRKDKAKIAVTQALKASAGIIIGKQHKQPSELGSVVSNRLPSDVLKSIADSQSSAKRNKREHPTEQNSKCRNYSTAAGNVVEMLQSPEKKKKAKIICLPTGKVCVEPITPKKRSILTCNGMEFHESPMTPCAVGFKVREVLSSNGNNHPTKDRKRERNNEGRKHSYPMPQWTQSGMFIEEEISSARLPRSICHGRISKKPHLGQHQANIGNLNFKQSALHRGDIKRSTTREILQLRERRQMHDQY